jgi:phage gpG-like protein
MIKHTKGVDLSSMINKLKNTAVRVGYFPNSTYPNGDAVAQVAATMELGSATQNIPARPTLSALKEESKGLNHIIAKGFTQAVQNGNDLKDTFEMVGMMAKASVQMAIKQTTSPALKQSTIDARANRHSKKIASSKPLVDSGQMLASVAYEVGAK